jgi:gliding motility-associated-like protein
VPDDNFEQALIDLGYDSGPLDDFVPTANINTVTSLNISGKGILNLTGIEEFAALSILDCSTNLLNTIDVRQNTNLTELYCFSNQLTSVDVSQAPNLIILWCYQNLLTSLNVSQNPNLISLLCGINQIKNLDLSNNIKLVVLSFQRNDISVIDLTNLTNLNRLLGGSNQLTALDVSNNLKLVHLAFQNNKVLVIDVSNLTNLDRLQCGRNSLTSLDVSQNSSLTYISCEENEITSIDISNNLILSTLICYTNKISELDISKNSSLVVIDCNNNNLCRLNLKNGNNMFAIADFKLNKSLGCVVVDDPSNIPANWEPFNFPNYVTSQADCTNTVNVDKLSDVISSSSYVLPAITNGNYFTGSGGSGIMLNTGDVISTSQTIYIYNKTICDSNETTFSVLIIEGGYYAPKYFTPNNDGSHDVWNVIDNSNAVNNITIYDKYGKLIKFLLPNSSGWDGTFKGKLLSSDDYWYVIVLNTGDIQKGHFTLKR